MRNNPIEKILIWLDQAKKSEINDPDAISLATVDENGFPNVRTVLLRRVEEDSFVFFTNYGSKKAQEIVGSGKVAFSFHWKSLAKQIRVRGHAEKEEGQVADDYYYSRALGSRIGAWASRQSEVLINRQELLNRVAKTEMKFGDDPPRPSFWGGIRIHPLSIEFWEEGNSRLHQRELWTRSELKANWSSTFLFP